MKYLGIFSRVDCQIVAFGFLCLEFEKFGNIQPCLLPDGSIWFFSAWNLKYLGIFNRVDCQRVAFGFLCLEFEIFRDIQPCRLPDSSFWFSLLEFT